MSLLAQLSRLLPLTDDELKQVLDYASTLSKEEAVGHFSNLLGDTPQVVEFVSSFNAKRADTRNEGDAVPKSSKRRPQNKAKPPIHTPAPRRVDALGPTPGTAYNKKGRQEDYISGQTGGTSPWVSGHAPHITNTSQPDSSRSSASRWPTPAPTQAPASAVGMPTRTPGPTAANATGKNGSRHAIATKPAAKVSIVGGTAMHGASTVLADLDDAIRALELSTNPSHASNEADVRRCHCAATRHPLQDAAPNCLHCGKIICLREGLGPCTFCGTPLLSPTDVQMMLRELKHQRGQERMAANRERHQKADVSSRARPFASTPRGQEWSQAEAQARDHRDRLLGFQAQNAKRTTVRDEAADFDVSSGGSSLWASPEARARQLKRQQKLLRTLEWNARPDYDKRRAVASIDLVQGKVVRTMMAVERPPSPEDGVHGPTATAPVLGDADGGTGRRMGGALSNNPLRGSMIKPVYGAQQGQGQQEEEEPRGRKAKATTPRRRVQQDDRDDDEYAVFDGGLLGGKPGISPAISGEDEHACG